MATLQEMRKMRDIVWRTDANARPWDVEVPRPILKKCAAGIWIPPLKFNGRKKRPSNAMKKRPSNAMSPEEAYALKERDERDPTHRPRRVSIRSVQMCHEGEDRKHEGNEGREKSNESQDQWRL